MTKTLCFIASLAWVLMPYPSVLAQAAPSTSSSRPVSVYIARFSTRTGIDAPLLASFRDLFEESFEDAFSGSGAYRVLDRETVEKVLSAASNEASLTSVDDFNSTQKARLKLAKAEGVVFGAVTDDQDSGEVVIAVKLQSFDSVIYWNQSVTMKRGVLRDRESRKAAMEQLVQAIQGSRSKTGHPPSSMPPANLLATLDGVEARVSADAGYWDGKKKQMAAMGRSLRPEIVTELVAAQAGGKRCQQYADSKQWQDTQDCIDQLSAHLDRLDSFK